MTRNVFCRQSPMACSLFLRLFLSQVGVTGFTSFPAFLCHWLERAAQLCQGLGGEELGRFDAQIL